MMRNLVLKRRLARRGAVLPLVVICMVAVLGMVALAIDIGMVAVARSQCQNAADSGAMAGARTINGNKDNNYNFAAVPTNAITAASYNKVLNSNVVADPAKVNSVNAYTWTSGNVRVETGAYSYYYDDANPKNEGFKIQFPRVDTTEPYSAVRCSVSSTNNFSFGRIFGLSTFNANATSVAVHRPRDVIIVMDLSGSMRFQSLPATYVNSSGVASPSSTSRPRTKSLNPETIFPEFGHYSDTSAAALSGNTSFSTGSEIVDPANISVTTNSGPPILEGFFANAYGVTPGPANQAFKRSSDAYAQTPGGDNYLRTANNTSGNPYAKTVNELVAANTLKTVAFENFGYDSYTGSTFKGYSEGPGYWGKTFFIWPPDPRGSALDPTNAANHADNGAKDWRQRFFFKYNTSTAKLDWLDHTNILFESAGAPSTLSNPTPGTNIVRLPSSTISVTENGVSVSYQLRINYAAILKWLEENPSHFPTQLRAGRIKYYDDLPDYNDTTLNSRWWNTSTLSNLNERFWRDYINFVLGLAIDENGNWTRRNTDPDGNALSSVPLSALIGNGDYYAWGTTQVSQKPDTGSNGMGLTVNGAINNTGGYAIGAGFSSNLNVKNLPAAPDVAGEWFVRFSNHNTLYRVTQVTLSSGTVTAIRIDDGTGKGLKNAVAQSQGMTFYDHQVGTVSANYAAGAGYSSDINVSNLALSPDVAVGNYVRFGNDPDSIYYVSGVTLTSGQVTGIRVNNGKNQGLINAITTGTEVHAFTSLSPYMNYADNPYRPRHQYWFGPMTFVDYLGNYNTTRFWWPGNVHEAQAWACKVGIQTAIDDIKNNHPSDFIGMAFFSSPKYSASGGGQHNRAVVPLGRNYDLLKASLWFPPSTVVGSAKEITPYDEDFDNVPRAKGGTAPGMGFMVAYNLLSSNTDLRLHAQPQPLYRGNAGGLGRKGANRLVIFETDGAPNTRAKADLVSTGSGSYYPIRIKYPENLKSTSNEFPSSGTYSNDEVFAVVEQICKMEKEGGYSTSRKPALIYPLGYGSLFDPNNKSSDQNNALTFMQTIAFKGNTANSSNGADFPDWQRIYGTNTQRIERMRFAFETIMQSGVQVSLIE